MVRSSWPGQGSPHERPVRIKTARHGGHTRERGHYGIRTCPMCRSSDPPAMRDGADGDHVDRHRRIHDRLLDPCSPNRRNSVTVGRQNLTSHHIECPAQNALCWPGSTQTHFPACPGGGAGYPRRVVMPWPRAGRVGTPPVPRRRVRGPLQPPTRRRARGGIRARPRPDIARSFPPKNWKPDTVTAGSVAARLPGFQNSRFSPAASIARHCNGQ
jgi:hypothetical protein